MSCFSFKQRNYQIEIPDSGKKYIINLAKKKCDCGSFYEYQSPYAHGIAAAKYQANDPLSFFYDAYSTRAYRKTYSHPIPPISLEDLAVDNNIKPPILRKQAGRLRAKRIRKGAWQRKQTRCGNCLDWGHNKSCRGQSVSSRRRKRARDWLAEVVDRESAVDSDNGDPGTDIEDEDENEGEDEDGDENENEDEGIEQEEEDQVIEEVGVELCDDESDRFEGSMDSDMT
jgi:hypothetical protein